MTISNTSTFVRAAGNGVTTVVNFPFKIFSAGDLIVRDILDSTGVPTTLTLTTHYAVTISSTDEGGSVTFVAALASGHTYDIRSLVSLTQDEDIRNQGRFLPEIHEGVFDKLERQIQDTRRLGALSPRLPDSELPTTDWDTLLSLENRKGKFGFFWNAITGAAELFTSIGATILSRSVIAQFLNPQTAGEIAAGAVPVNYWYDPGKVDRYGNNSTPGTTDMTAAFNAAYQVAKQTKCSVCWGATAPYRLNSPVNCTNMRGVVSWDESSGNTSFGTPSIIIAHDGQTYSHGFDLSASTEMVFNNVVGTNLAGKVPNSLFFMARNSVGSGAGQHRFFNCHTPSAATFKNIFYATGSEENVIDSSVLYNSQPGSAIININATNPSGYTSSFLTIATGPQSNVTHFLSRVNLFNTGNSGSANEVCVSLERAGNFSWIQGSAYAPHGLAYISVGGTVGSNYLTIDTVRGETDGAATTPYGIAVRTSAATGVDSHAHWRLSQFALEGNGYLLDFNTTSAITDLRVGSCFSNSGNLLNLYSASYSIVEHGPQVVTGQVGGTVANCNFIGTRANITLNGTNTANSGFDEANGRTWETGDSYTAPSTACTGAITAAVVYTLTKFNRNVVVTLPAISATASAATNFAFGSALPAAYRPASDARIPIMVIDNGTAQVGVVIVTAATGVMNVYKNPSSAGNFTAAAGAGLPGITPIGWTL